MVERVSINAIGDFFFYTKVGIGHDLFMRRGKITTPPPPTPPIFLYATLGGGFRRRTIGHLVCQTESPFVHHNKTGQASVLGAIYTSLIYDDKIK